MKEALVSKGPVCEIVDSPVPEISTDQILIRVVASGMNPKDWKIPEWTGISFNQGDDIAGTVERVGTNVFEFKRGDRVAAFHEIMAPGGSYAEFAVAWSHNTFHIPDKTSFEEASTLPLAVITAVFALYHGLGLPQPWIKAIKPTPLIIYGAATAVGSYAIQLARQSGIHPLICVAGKSAAHVESLIDRAEGDTIIDYRQSGSAVTAALRKAAEGEKALYCLDAVSEHGSYIHVSTMLDGGAKMALVLPGQEYKEIPDHVEKYITSTEYAQSTTGRDMAFVYFRYISRGLNEGWFRPHPHRLIPEGLHGVERGLQSLKDGQVNAFKYTVRIADTAGLSN